ncbi:MAG TPA: MgtC/SapB family protein [Candidatus Limnocylindria bacterium]|nr:MgtC/SapB family protein [Candidatus Limnocylindria bacterium]
MPVDFDLRNLLADPQVEGLLRVIVAGLVAIFVGLEREVQHKPAGARTYALVAMGSAMFTVVGIQAFGEGDPGARVAAQIVTGIGFLGAGTILHMRMHVVGLTTAAGLWAMAAIGMAIGGGLYLLGIGVGVLLFLLLRFLRLDWLSERGLESDEVEEAPENKAGGERR